MSATILEAICVNALAAKTQRDAEYLATTELLKFLNLGRGIDTLLPEPAEDLDRLWHPRSLDERTGRAPLRCTL